jgi:SAM-dependent methyltransferase
MPAMDYDRISFLYDAYVRGDFDLDFFIQEARQVDGHVLELMSGTGRVSIPLIESGARLTCVDASRSMLDGLEKKLVQKGLRASVVHADVCELSLNAKYDLIFIPFHSFSEITDESQQRRALNRIYDHLTDQGRFICTLHNPAVRLKDVNGQKKPLGRFPLPSEGETLVLWSKEKYDRETRIVSGRQYYEVFDSNDRQRDTSFLEIAFYAHDRASFESLAIDAGFRVVDLFGDYERSAFDETASPVMIWMFEKW